MFDVHVGLVIAKDGSVTSVLPDSERVSNDVFSGEDNRELVQKLK